LKLILASTSPRRAEVLRDAGIDFEVFAPEYQEIRLPREPAERMVERLAEAKARAAASQLGGLRKNAIVLGADTAVELDGEIFGKPQDAAHAFEMLAALSGRVHRVLTGICLIHEPELSVRSAVEITEVTMGPLDAAEIHRYAATAEPFDKAGGYAIQGIAGRYITAINGCYFNVVGLPLAKLYRLLKDLGWVEPA
jgi:septum formation protein